MSQITLIHKIILWIALPICSIIACSPVINQPAAAIPLTGTNCANEFFPVKPNATWTYNSSGGPNGDFSFTNTITEIQADKFILTSQSPSLTYTQTWICTSEGLQVLQLNGPATASISTQNITGQFTTLSVNGVSIPRAITPGMKWQYDLNMQGTIPMPGEQAQSPVSFSIAMQELGKENVAVPAGTFDTMKIMAAFVVQINADFQGTSVPYTINGSSILWYAPSVGFVKSIENVDFSGTPFTTSTELSSYQIP